MEGNSGGRRREECGARIVRGRRKEEGGRRLPIEFSETKDSQKVESFSA
jgi:hypothetical protein